MAVEATNILLSDYPEKEDLRSIYSNYNTHRFGLVKAEELQLIYERLRNVKLSIPQIEASLSYVCSGYPEFQDTDEEELLDVLKEMDRRSFLAQDLQWEFTLLDRYGKGSITIDNAIFLFKMVHGEYFSKERFDNLINKRAAKDGDVTFQEIEVDLCNIPSYIWIKEQKATEKKLKAQQLAKERLEEKDRKEEEARKAEIEKLKKDVEVRLAKEKAREEELKRKEEEDTRKRLEEEHRKREEVERRKREEEERLKGEEVERLRKADEDKRKKEGDDRLKKEEQDRLAREEAERLKKVEEDRLKQIEEDRLKEEEVAREAEQRRLQEEAERQAEEERLKQEEAERLEKQRREEEENRLAEEEKRKALEKAKENWKDLKDLGEKEALPDDLQALKEMKEKRESKEAEEDEGKVDEISLAEDNAEGELLEAEEMLENATSEEEKKAAEEARAKAEADALRNREKRLRLQLKTAVKLRNKPKLDVSIDEAKESKIEALKPDIVKAEVVSESLQLGEDLEDAMAKRDLPLIEQVVEKIKSKGFENQHVVQILEAEKLIDKLKRLEKAKKDILELNQRTIAIIRSYSNPIPAIREVMIATYMILGYEEKKLKDWKFIQALLGRTGKESLKRMCTTFDPSKLDLKMAGVAETKYFNNYSLESITDNSAALGTFYAWSTNMIEEARNWIESAEFRKKVEEKRKQEMEEKKKLEEARKSKSVKTNPKGKNAGKSNKKGKK